MFVYEQMSEGSKAVEFTETRKKRRHSGFRYSSRKVLERSRLKRESAKAGGWQFDSVRKALSYPSDHRDCAAESSYPPCLDSVLEHDGAGLDLTFGNAIIQEDFNQKVSHYNSPLIV
jgi:hypothetical protein